MPANHRLPLWLRENSEGESTTASRDALARDASLSLVEAVLFTGDEPMSLRKIATTAGLTDLAVVRRLLKKLQDLYDQDQTAFQVEEIAGGFQLLTRSPYHRWLAGLRRQSQDLRLTGAMRETLAIVAYRQPIMRADIESIRGVQCSETLRLLMEKGLVRIAGRHDSLGRPVLYGTTKKFLQIFGLKSLKELPKPEHFGT